MRATSAYAQRLAQQFRFSPVGRVTPCAPLAFNVRRAEDCTPYGYAFADLKAPGYAPYVALPVRKKLPHTIPQWVAESSWFFITINCVPPGKNQLCRPDSGDAILTAVKFNHETQLVLSPMPAYA
jgi:hypothetical protein